MPTPSPMLAGPARTTDQGDDRSVRSALPYLSLIVLAQITIALLLVASAA